MQIKKFKCSLVIAAFNCELSIRQVVCEALSALESSMFLYEYDVVIVDDGSTDKTWKVLNELRREYKNIKLLKLSKNFGQQSAMMAGFSVCNSDLVAYCDDDGQSPVNELAILINEIINNNNSDMVWAKYTIPISFSFSGLGRYLNEMMLRIVFKKPKGLEFGNMWIAKRFVIDRLLFVTTPSLYLGGLMLSITTNMSNIPFQKRERMYGESNYTLYKLINLFLNGLIFSSIAPLRIASVLGVLSAMFSFLIIGLVIFAKIIGISFPIGYASIASLILLIGGIQLIMFGVIGEYIGRIHIESKNRPLYFAEIIEKKEDENQNKC